MTPVPRHSTRSITSISLLELKAVDLDGRMDMDIVIYSPSSVSDGEERCVGAVQEDANIAPLFAWSMDPNDAIVVHYIIPEKSLSYESRQVGGGKGAFPLDTIRYQ